MHQIIHKIVSLPRITLLFSQFVSKVDYRVLKMTKRRFSPTGFIAGWPVIILTTIGARSGLPRQTPLVGIPDGKRIILIASNFGKSNNPAWYYNLKAKPIALVSVKQNSSFYLAREAEDDEYDYLWKTAIKVNPGYQSYQQRANRKIPILVLTQIERNNLPETYIQEFSI